MALINCPECNREISDKAQSCPQCGCPIAKRDPETKPALPAMIWDGEGYGFISVKCPQCSKISNIKQSSADKTATGYRLKGEGKCSCGLTFNEIYRDERVKCPNCGSTEITVMKEGFNAQGACCGALLVGPLGLLCGANEANKLNRHCLKCGHKWPIGDSQHRSFRLS